MSKKWPRSRRQKISNMLVYLGFACFLCGFLCFTIHMFLADADVSIAGQPLSHLSSIANNEDHLYLHYGDVPMIKVYDLNGIFQYDMRTWPVPKDYGGVIRILADGHDLYLITRSKDVYLWTNDVYVQCWKDEAGYQKWNELNEKYRYYNAEPSEPEGVRYEIRGEDVWHVYEDGTAEKVVNRHWIFRILNPTVLLLSPWPLFVIGFMLLKIGTTIRW